MKNKKIKVIFGIVSLFVIFITFLIYIWCNKKYDIGPVAQKNYKRNRPFRKF